jgi:hypothetical protein
MMGSVGNPAKEPLMSQLQVASGRATYVGQAVDFKLIEETLSDRSLVYNIEISIFDSPTQRKPATFVLQFPSFEEAQKAMDALRPSFDLKKGGTV